MAPDRVVDVQALAGDRVDNVPGAPGIGIKTAALLINEYGDLDTLLARAGEITQPKRREALIEQCRSDPLSQAAGDAGRSRAAGGDAGRAGGAASREAAPLHGFPRPDGVPHPDQARGRGAEDRRTGRRGAGACRGRRAGGRRDRATARTPAARGRPAAFDTAAYECVRDAGALQPLDRPDPRARPCRRRYRDHQP